jgi:hypothetical protein
MFGFSTNTDPVLVFDDFGNLYYSHIAFNANAFATTPPSTSVCCSCRPTQSTGPAPSTSRR